MDVLGYSIKSSGELLYYNGGGGTILSAMRSRPLHKTVHESRHNIMPIALLPLPRLEESPQHGSESALIRLMGRPSRQIHPLESTVKRVADVPSVIIELLGVGSIVPTARVRRCGEDCEG